ncbi:MAG: hypothetical protein ABF630_10430 [Liquorilactobacillus sp.]|uniref:hypothetical protein n=1 Tax=Liquorilactobacillus nagelii TaxID=82688 RepID=UPI0039ED8A9E
MREQNFEQTLQQFYQLLLYEKKCLINDQPNKLIKLVAEKQKYIDPFQSFSGQITPIIKNKVKMIQIQQQENLLLTKQAIGFEEMLLKTIRKNLKMPQITYTQNDLHRKPDQYSLINWEA